jgi:uncharacterized damage-inducible protein DinB
MNIRDLFLTRLSTCAMSGVLLLRQLAAYSRWANTRFLDRLSEETEELLDRPVASSFPSLRATCLHIRDAESAWTLRLQGISTIPWPAEPATTLASWQKYTQALVALVDQATEEWSSASVVYHDLRGNRHEQPRWEMLLHCFNHSTQHRGQLITMMRTLGLDRIPATDLIVYQRSLRQG